MHRVQAIILNSKSIKIALDAIAVVLGFLVALLIRFNFAIPSEYLANVLLALPALVLLFLLANYVMRMYAGHWKYASFDEILSLSSATIISTAILFIAILLIPNARIAIPISVAVMGGVLSLFTMAFIRLEFRFFSERKLRSGQGGSRKVLLIGAGEAGDMVARDMLRHPEYDYSPIAFVDDDPRKRNMVVQGVPVLGGREEIPRIVTKHDIDEIFITIPSAKGENIREILTFCEQTEAEMKILPGIVLSMTGEVGVASVQKLRLEDLLGREPVETDLASISAYIAGKVVMVTGAGGSIGLELSRQLSGLGPSRLLLLDRDSTGLYNLDLDLARRTDICPRDIIIADIRDADRLESIFKRYRPQVIFHSAALKHVPMLESHPSEAFKNNVLGTRNLAQLAIKHRVECFILISTDKAVQPVSVMGATKRAAELLIKNCNGQNGTLFSAVRFGNVLGSRGSVVPVFQKQIEEGGPVLVTHHDIERYFMTIEEAAQLVIQAGAYTEGGDIFILDMGEPVRIMDLANQMVRLLGNGKKIDIRLTGLRPGEKLRERLVFKAEEMLPTPHPKINKVVGDSENLHDFEAQVDSLIEAAVGDDGDKIRSLLSDLLPSYRPNVLKTPEKPALRLVKENRTL